MRRPREGSYCSAVNNALEGAVPGPKLPLIKGSYHILRETAIPGTISESGFMTNKEFDELSTRPDYPKREAAAIRKGAVKYWTDRHLSLVAQQLDQGDARRVGQGLKDPGLETPKAVPHGTPPSGRVGAAARLASQLSVICETPNVVKRVPASARRSPRPRHSPRREPGLLSLPGTFRCAAP